MAFPKISAPLYDFTIPSTGKKVKYRPFTVKDEKILLMAKQSDKLDKKAIFDVFCQLINNCVIDQIDVHALTPFDVEAFFIALRSKSVGNVIEAKIVGDDGEKYDVEINLDEAQVSKVLDKKARTVMITDEVGVVLRYPTIKDALAAEEEERKSAALLRVCMEAVFDKEEVNPVDSASRTEVEEFIGSLSKAHLDKFEPFFSSFPEVYVDVSYVRKDGTKESRRLQGIEHFFA
jgi:hypothetical protein